MDSAISRLPLLLLVSAAAGVAIVTAQDSADASCPERAAAGDASCRVEPRGAVCSGRGQCVCGECVCDQRFNPSESVYGRFCECDNFSCARHSGQLCGGGERGQCACGQCQCRPGWTGDACDCRAANTTCIAPGSDQVCSGRGICECGQCLCFEGTNGRYFGRFCNECPTCPNRCSEFKSCVECRIFKAGAFRSNCTSSCAHLTISETELPHKNMREDELLCSFFLSDALEPCRYKFFYSSSDEVVRVPPSQPCLNGQLQASATDGSSVPAPGSGARRLVGVIWEALLIGPALAIFEYLLS